MGDERAALGDNADGEVEVSEQVRELTLGAVLGEEVVRN